MAVFNCKEPNFTGMKGRHEDWGIDKGQDVKNPHGLPVRREPLPNPNAGMPVPWDGPASDQPQDTTRFMLRHQRKMF